MTKQILSLSKLVNSSVVTLFSSLKAINQKSLGDSQPHRARMPDLWLYRLDFTPPIHTPKSTEKAWSLQTSRQPTGDRGNTHNTNMEIKPVTKTMLCEEIHRLHDETFKLYTAIKEAQLPEDRSLVSMTQQIYWAVGQLKESGISLGQAQDKFTDEFDYVSTQG
jgi:hypothetical protein